MILGIGVDAQHIQYCPSQLEEKRTGSRFNDILASHFDINSCIFKFELRFNTKLPVDCTKKPYRSPKGNGSMTIVS